MYNNYKGIKTPLIFLSTHLNSSHPFDYRNVTAAAMEERDNAKHEKEEAIMTQAALIQDAVKTARLNERQHFAKVIVRHRVKERESCPLKFFHTKT